MVFLFGRHYSKFISLNSVLNDVFGISYTYSNYLIRRLGYRRFTRLASLSGLQLKFIVKKALKNRLLLASLSSFCNETKKKKIRLRTYQGLRLLQGMPANGQRTRSNARTCRKLKWLN